MNLSTAEAIAKMNAVLKLFASVIAVIAIAPASATNGWRRT